MAKANKTKEQLITELVQMRQRIAELEVLQTERKQVEEALLESERNFRNSLDNSPLGIRIVNAEGELLYANQVILDIYGYGSVEELRAVPAIRRHTPESYAEHQKRVKRRKQGQPVPSNYEMSIVRKDGEIRQVLVSRKEVIWDGKTQFQVIYQDITERKQAEEALIKSEEKYSTLVEKGNDGVAIVQDGLIKFVNSKLVEITGFSLEEGLDKPFADFVSPEYRESAADEYKKRMAGEKTPSKTEVEILTKDGGRVPVEVNTSGIEYEGRPADMTIVRDISERRKMQAQLIMAERLASVGQLASGIAHELNNPLTSVIGFSQLLSDKDIPEDIKEDVKIIYSEAQRAAGVVKNLLTFARKHASVKQLVNLNSIIETVLELRAYEQRVSNIKVNTRFAFNLLEVSANAFQLQQVFINIIINAEYFMIEAHHRGTLIITTEKAGNIIKASFADDGPGILAKNLGRLFSPFFTTKELGKGTGLGLSICHGIVTEHGGRIYAESKLGKGATFVVELPISTPYGGGT